MTCASFGFSHGDIRQILADRARWRLARRALNLTAALAFFRNQPDASLERP